MGPGRAPFNRRSFLAASRSAVGKERDQRGATPRAQRHFLMRRVPWEALIEVLTMSLSAGTASITDTRIQASSRVLLGTKKDQIANVLRRSSHHPWKRWRHQPTDRWPGGARRVPLVVRSPMRSGVPPSPGRRGSGAAPSPRERGLELLGERCSQELNTESVWWAWLRAAGLPGR